MPLQFGGEDRFNRPAAEPLVLVPLCGALWEAAQTLGLVSFVVALVLDHGGSQCEAHFVLPNHLCEVVWKEVTVVVLVHPRIENQSIDGSHMPWHGNPQPPPHFGRWMGTRCTNESYVRATL